MSFPETNILDTFSIDSGPPPTGWLFTYSDVVATATTVSGELLMHIIAGGDTGSIYWSAETFTADQECYITLGSTPIVADSYGALMLRITDPEDETIDGYKARFFNNLDVDIIRISTGDTVLSGESVSSLATGDGIGFRVEGTTLTLFHKPAAGAWAQIAQTTDSSVSGAGYIGVESQLVLE